MKKNPANRSAFFQSRVMVAFATCAIAAFLTLLAYALAPGGHAQAAPQQAQSNQVSDQQQSTAPLAQEQTDPFAAMSQENIFQGQVVSIERHPLSMLSPYDQAVLTGQRALPLSPDVAHTGIVGDAQRPIEPAQATATPTPAGAVVLLDTFNGRTVSFTSSVPHTYMGDGFTNNTIAGSTTYVSLRSYTFYMIYGLATAVNYTDVHARLALWNSYNGATAAGVFANAAAFFDVDLGATAIPAGGPFFFTVTVTVLPPFPFFAGGPGTNWGYAQNFQSSTTGGGVVDDTNLTSSITYGAPYGAGVISTNGGAFVAPTFGYYRNAGSEVNFNFLSTSARLLTGLNSQGVGIIIRGDLGTGPTPTPASTGTPGTPSPTPGPTATPSPSITPPATVCSVSEVFDDVTNLVVPKGWIETNHSTTVGSTGWFQGSTAVFNAHTGAPTSYIGANFNNDGGAATDTISNWLLTPPVTLQNGGTLIFYTRTVDAPAFPDRLQVRMSTSGNSSNVGSGPTGVGDFTTLLLDINPTYTLSGYPSVWTQFSITLSGLGLPIKGRLAFRYFVENGGPSGVNSDFIGIDTVSYTCSGPTPTPAPTATPTPTPTPTATMQPTGTPSPTCQPVITLSSSQTITAGNSASCNNGIGHTDNSYWRAFNMAGFTNSVAYNVTSVSFGIEEASTGNVGAGTPTPTPGGPGTQPVTVRLYTNTGGSFPAGTRTQIATTTVNVPDQSLTVFTAPLVVTVPAGTSELIMEVFTPNGETPGNLFFIGSNAATQGGPTYISATDCGITNPTDTFAIGFPDMHAVMNVNGSCAPTNTPTPPPVIISGRVGNCASPAPTATPPAVPTPPALPPVPNVIMTLTGSSSGSTLTDGAGNYSFTVAAGGTYTITPSKAPIPPAGPNINNLDVLAIQRHFLSIAIIPNGCRLTAADANVSGTVNGQDVIAVQRFFLGFTSGTGSVGQYKFIPTTRSYPAVGSNQTNQNYDMYVVGDAAASFNNRPGTVENDLGFSNVATVSLPQISAEQSKSNFTAPVTSSVIDKQDRIVGFQGDFTFDERVVTFATEPVQKAGLTSGNWNVSGNVLPGNGPIRTLRVSAYSTDFTPLSGAGALFELKVVNAKSGETTPLAWASSENGFLFMDADLNTQRPGNSVAGHVGPPSKR